MQHDSWRRPGRRLLTGARAIGQGLLGVALIAPGFPGLSRHRVDIVLRGAVALAGEGNGNPFPFSGSSAIADVPTNVIQMTGQTPLMTKNPPNSVPNGNRAMATAIRQYAGVPVTSGDVLPTTGSQAPSTGVTPRAPCRFCRLA